MQVETYLFGTIEVDPDKVIEFPQGLSGFENSRRYTLVHEANANIPASYTLQSLDDPNLAFLIADPEPMGFHYELALEGDEVTLLQNPAPEDVTVMMLLFKREGEAGYAANFRAPLVINAKARIGLQKLIPKPRPNIVISNLASEV